jgi:pSer/pThr/pTyr-binding forkhead associated (FHA) protein
VHIGRLPGNSLVVADNEVSGWHVRLRWDAAVGAWMAADSGSLNGTALNGQRISAPGRRPGEEHRLTSDDILQLGSTSCLKVRRNHCAGCCGGGSSLAPAHVLRSAMWNLS